MRKKAKREPRRRDWRPFAFVVIGLLSSLIAWSSRPRLTEHDVRNATYTVLLPGGPTPVTLNDGYWSNGYYRVQLRNTAFGDLDGDFRGDAAIVLATNTGGNGTFVELAAVLNEDGKPVHVSLEGIGDRAGVFDLQIANRQIKFEARTRHDPRSAYGPIAFSYHLDNRLLVNTADPNDVGWFSDLCFDEDTRIALETPCTDTPIN